MERNALPQMASLASVLRTASDSYYKHQKSLMSDVEYDCLFMELVRWEQAHPNELVPNSPTKGVGSDLSNAAPGIKHWTPMLSVDNIGSKSGLLEWMERKVQTTGGKARFMLEKKYDGVGVSLHYMHGILISAATRGDGETGTDISLNIRGVKNIKTLLPDEDVPDCLELRGEIILPDEAFARANEGRTQTGLPAYQTRRNAVASMVMNDSPETFIQRGARVVVYQAIGEGLPDSNTERLFKVERWGFAHSFTDKTFSNPAELISAITDHENTYRGCGFATDGMVIKVEQNSLRRDDLNTSRYYDWAAAYKWQAPEGETELLGVRFSVGRSGQISATLCVMPVNIDGRCVSSVSLNGLKNFKVIGLHEGDALRLKLGGDCIPYLSDIDTSKRKEGVKPVCLPDRCPDCGKPLHWEGERLVCSNADCMGQITRKMVHLARTLGIKGVGVDTAEKVYNSGSRDTLVFLSSLDDLLFYGLNKRVAEKITVQIPRVAKKTLSTWIEALSIPGIGGEAAKAIGKSCKTWDGLFALLDSNNNIKGVSPAQQCALKRFFSDSSLRFDLSNLSGK